MGSVTRHDVLNQLTAIAGYNELLGMMIKDEKMRSFLEKETQAVDKIRRQFQFAKDYQNLATQPPRWQHLQNTLFRVSEEIDTKAITITCETSDVASDADPLFGKALTHLFENTFRYGTADRDPHHLPRRRARVVMTVKDNGAGIPAGEKVKIFERGYGNGTGGFFLVGYLCRDRDDHRRDR